ncbi:hypothetical protein TrRE_jg10280, partial [Triparma retinervis]
FVPQYYKKWTQTPSVLHKFYSTAATFKHATSYTLDVLDSVSGAPAIRDWMSSHPQSVKFDLDRGTIDAMKLPHDSHLVVVTGYMTVREGGEEGGGEGEDWRTFSQTFVLGKDNPDSKQWKVVSDCLRIGMGEGDQTKDGKEEEVMVVEGGGEKEEETGGGGDEEKAKDEKEKAKAEKEKVKAEEKDVKEEKGKEEAKAKASVEEVKDKGEEGSTAGRKKKERRGKKRGEEEKKELASEGQEAAAGGPGVGAGAQEEKSEGGKVQTPSTWANLFAGGEDGKASPYAPGLGKQQQQQQQ